VDPQPSTGPRLAAGACVSIIAFVFLVVGCGGPGTETRPPPGPGPVPPPEQSDAGAIDASRPDAGGLLPADAADPAGDRAVAADIGLVTDQRPADGRDSAPPVSDSAPPDRAQDSGADPGDGGPGPVAYNPCPPKGKPCVALPLGDSLTQGAGSSGGGYRRELFRLAVARGQSVTFVGSRSSGPAMLPGVPVPFPRGHEGYGGYNIQRLAALIADNDTIATYKPDIVMLEIGTNNGLRNPGANVPGALAALGAMIDQILAADSHLLLIVAQITPNKTDVGIAQIQAFNRGIPALVAARAAAGKHIAIVDIYQAFVANPDWKNAYLPSNDVHPNDAGYDAMGRGWYGALGPLLR
jgi:lysophospholipase L1-like esterase